MTKRYQRHTHFRLTANSPPIDVVLPEKECQALYMQLRKAGAVWMTYEPAREPEEMFRASMDELGYLCKGEG